MDTFNFLKGESRFFPIQLLFSVSVIISFCTRLALLASFGRTMDIGFINLLLSFSLGVIYDSITGLVLIVPFILLISFTTDFIYSKKGIWLAISFFSLLLFILIFTHLLPRDFNNELYKGIIYYVALRFFIYVLLVFRSGKLRLKWRAGILLLAFFVTLFLLLFNAVSEWFFWNEFASRYNFIAVDYLVYTTEVIGNIRESYPVTGILLVVGAITLAMVYVVRKPVFRSVQSRMTFGKRATYGLSIIAAVFMIAFITPPGWKYFSKNNYANELAGNGIYDFVQAFRKNELDFFTYYKTLPDSTAFRVVKQDMETVSGHFTSAQLSDFQRQIRSAGPERKMNVVLITVESLSASFMEAFGDTNHITPGLDSLAHKGILFTNLYASGTRTVRGLEALALSIPPLPGQSIIKRPHNNNLFSLGTVFRNKGYITQFIYGGYGYFDNMNSFFSHNGYDVIDRTALGPGETHYENIWGVADEDLFTLALKTMDKNYKARKPFFTEVMTVSNHRPYTYPDGRINIPSSMHSRNGAVKYTDYAITGFLKQAARKPWFANTLFVIVADHCASSAGKLAMPLPGYHIPMIMYSPGHIPSGRVNALMAQVDVGPTILGILHFSYMSRFFGQDIFRISPEKRKAFIGTYQGLGFLKGDTLVVQSPLKEVKTYKADPVSGEAKEITVNSELVQQAIAYYQYAAWLMAHQRHDRQENQQPRMIPEKYAFHSIKFMK